MRTVRIDCHVPITLRIVGVPTDDQLVAVGRALTRAVAARLAEAERLLADRHRGAVGGRPQARERYDPSRAGSTGYAVPSYQDAGDPVAVPTSPAVPAAVGAQPPVDASPADPATPPPAAAPTHVAPALPDLDANEAAERLAHPDLARFDLNQTVAQNEDAVRAVALAAFGSKDAVKLVFDSLSPYVRNALAEQYMGASPDELIEHQLQFFIRMRLYFPSWHDLLAHFRDFVRVQRQHGRVDIVLHGDAAARLERVLDLLAKHGHPLPSITGGFQLRHFDEREIQSAGFMIHALGYAIDIAAQENPKIGFQRSGAGRFDPYGIAANIDPGSAHMDMGPDGPRTVKAMGIRMAGDDSTLAADDQDPAAKAYFQLFEKRFHDMRQGSLGFIGTITDDHRTKLLDLRKRYLDVLREIRSRHPADPKAMAGLQAKRRALLAGIPALVTEWITALDRAFVKSLVDHLGMAALRPPAEIRVDLLRNEKDLQQARQEQANAQAAKTTAVARRDAAAATYQAALARERAAASGEAFRKAMDAVSAARQSMLDRGDELAEALGREIDTRRRLGTVSVEHDGLVAALAMSNLPAFAGVWNWQTKLKELRNELANPDLSSPAGVAAFEALMTGDLRDTAPPENPPLLRLLETGFFNPKGAFDLQFFEEMAHSGFVPGATWNFGGADPMHFELQEGKDRIGKPGIIPGSPN